MKKKLLISLLVAAMSCSLLTGCHNSKEEGKATVDVEKTDYDPKEAAKDFKMGELNDVEKDYVVEMGFFNCDHMVPAIIGEKAGIYEALGLKVNVTKTAETEKSVISGAMDVGYSGTRPRSLAQNPPYFIAAANHVGGSRYLVAREGIDTAEDLLGKTISNGPDLNQDSEWCAWARDYGYSTNDADYNLVSMGQQDAMFALKAGQIDAFVCCDPYASIAEYEGFGHILAVSWGTNLKEGEVLTEDNWGTCCTYIMNKDFYAKCPELARRLAYAHMLSVKYLYEHPYNAAMMFADGFDVDPYPALRTVYMKTVAEGRTITWEWTEKNLENEEAFERQFPGVLEEDILTKELAMSSLKMAEQLAADAGIPKFSDFIKNDIDPICPIGTTFEDWYNIAKTIDGISEEDAVDISKTATPYLNENLKDRNSK